MYQDLYGRATDLHEYFARQRQYGAKVCDWIARRDGPHKRRVLELGCGAGGALSVFHERGHDVAGCDFGAPLLAYGQARGVPNLHRGEVEELTNTLGAASFDLIYLHHVFEHVGAPLPMLHTLHRLLKPSGKLLIIVPDIENIDSFPCPAGDALPMLHIAHKFNFSPEGLAALAARANLAGEHVMPGGAETNWSTMPELWMVARRAAGGEPITVDMRQAGERVWRRLRRTEWKFQWGLCPIQLRRRFVKLTPRFLRKRAA
jgi:SAM-dependent methyltransferase